VSLLPISEAADWDHSGCASGHPAPDLALYPGLAVELLPEAVASVALQAELGAAVAAAAPPAVAALVVLDVVRPARAAAGPDAAQPVVALAVPIATATAGCPGTTRRHPPDACRGMAAATAAWPQAVARRLAVASLDAPPLGAAA
jgi:hypothetical protein